MSSVAHFIGKEGKTAGKEEDNEKTAQLATGCPTICSQKHLLCSKFKNQKEQHIYPLPKVLKFVNLWVNHRVPKNIFM
jgi:hypothetical protein